MDVVIEIGKIEEFLRALSMNESYTISELVSKTNLDEKYIKMLFLILDTETRYFKIRDTIQMMEKPHISHYKYTVFQIYIYNIFSSYSNEETVLVHLFMKHAVDLYNATYYPVDMFVEKLVKLRYVWRLQDKCYLSDAGYKKALAIMSDDQNYDKIINAKLHNSIIVRRKLLPDIR